MKSMTLYKALKKQKSKENIRVLLKEAKKNYMNNKQK